MTRIPRAGVPAVAVALAVAALTGCGGSTQTPQPTTPVPTQISAFPYDQSQPLAFSDRGRVNAHYPIAIQDISYASGSRRVDAYLAVPPAKGRRAAVIYVHGTGGDRRQLLIPAVWLAGRGAVTLAITAPSSEETMPAGLQPADRLRWERDVATEDVIAVRRAVDLLSARGDVDPKRIGYVGWSAGAKTGALLAGSEPRLHALVLMSGGATPLPAYAVKAPVSLRPAILDYLGAVDPLRLIRRATPGSLLLQDGTKDAVVPHAALVWLARAAPKGTEVRWYPTGHDLGPAALRSQLVWLTRKLRIGPRVPGAKTG
jgi:dienelactone hydrolase